MVKRKKTSNLKFNKGDYVVYPSYGPGKILAIKKEIINLNLDLLSIMSSLRNRLSSTYTIQLFYEVLNSNYIFV